MPFFNAGMRFLLDHVNTNAHYEATVSYKLMQVIVGSLNARNL